MNNLNDFIKATQKLASRWTKECRQNPNAWHSIASLGVTEGQVLWTNHAGKLEMLPCWLEIRIANFQGTGEFKVAFNPLLPANKDKPVRFRENVYLDSIILNDLTGLYHVFGGKTIEFRHNTCINFDLNKDIDRQIYLYVRSWMRTFEHYVYEDNGSLIVVGDTIFSLGDAADIHQSDDDCYVQYYDELVFIEPDNADKREALLSRAVNTGHNTTIVPTIWIKDDKQRKCFLDFKADWSQSCYGKRVTGRVGKFIVAHEVCNDKLLTQTSLRISNSAFPQSSNFQPEKRD